MRFVRNDIRAGGSTMADCDVAVIGDGVAGLTAALFSARHGRTTMVFGSLAGGELLSVDAVEDFPGFPDPFSGYEFCPALVDQAIANGAAFHMTEVLSAERDGAEFVIHSAQGDVRARALVVASGGVPRKLDVPGEERLSGKGVSHCASCDGPIFGGQVVGVVGGGDSAPTGGARPRASRRESLRLPPRPRVLCAGDLQERVIDHPRIEPRFQTVVEEIVGDEAVSSVRVRDLPTGNEEIMEINALFVYVGIAPRTDFLNGLVALDEVGLISTDTSMRTATAGLFAAGIVRFDAAGQAITSAGDGATASIAAHRYLLEIDGLPGRPKLEQPCRPRPGTCRSVREPPARLEADRHVGRVG